VLHDVRDIVDSSPEVDATLRTPPLHIKPTASQVRTQLIEKKELLKDEDLPNRSMISTLLNKFGYHGIFFFCSDMSNFLIDISRDVD
jgi:hypothetical protein